MPTSDEIKEAMRYGRPVIYSGIEYAHINAYTYRVIKEWNGTRRAIMQVELADRHKNAVAIAPAEKIEIIGEEK